MIGGFLFIRFILRLEDESNTLLGAVSLLVPIEESLPSVELQLCIVP